jgi:hypothetical protein
MELVPTTTCRHPAWLWLRVAFSAACVLVVALATLAMGGWAADPVPATDEIQIKEIKLDRPVDFRTDLAPILKGKCLACHTGSGAEGGIVLDTGTNMVECGAVVPRQPAQSSLLAAAAHQKKPFMPPAKNKKNATELTPQELGLVKLWIEQGAKDSLRDGVAAQAAAAGPFVNTDDQRSVALPPKAIVLDVLPPEKEIAEVFDHYVDAKLQNAGVTPAHQADDATLIRRLTLDLCGRIPTLSETQTFVESTEADKRTQLVDRLMASPGFLRHQETELSTLLMTGTKWSLREYLTKVVADHRPWDQIYRELMTADESDATVKGSGEFIKQRVADTDKLTTDVSSIFFGVNISCARCHDHPRVRDWKQDHYYGMKSFFARSFDNGGFLGERDYGVVKFKTTKGVEREAKLMFLTGKVADVALTKEPTPEEQKKERERLDAAKKNKTPPPAPSFSTRAKLVDLSLQAGQRDFFARSIVNRMWYRFLGYGLVMPIDQMHSENPPSHPELLQWLARDTVAHKYDLHRLIRGVVLSKTYARSSRWDGDGEAPKPKLFAVANVRPLTPMQLATSLRLATTDPTSLTAGGKADEIEKRIAGLEDAARGFAPLIEQPREDFQISVSEALLFSNMDRMQKEFLAESGDRLVGRLKQIKDSNEAIDLAVRTVLSRPPTDAERAAFSQYLTDRKDRPVDAYRQLVWAMLTSAEFRFNY